MTMGTNLFIGRRFLKIYKGSFSGPVIRIATTGIALSVAVMIVAVVIVKGFQLEIRNKVIGFSGHVRIKPFQMSVIDQQIPLSFDREDVQLLKQSINGLVSVQPSAEKAGIIKSDDQIEGCIFKGVNHDYYTGFLDAALTEGHFPRIGGDTVSNEIIISRITASRLNFKTGDDLRMYFLLPGESQPRGRKFTITGIFDTGLYEFDKKYMFGDLGHLQRLNQWEDNEAGVIEILVDDYRNMTSTAEMAGQILHYDLEVWDVRELYPEIFNWLDLLDMNVTVIIVIMLVVAMINIITILLIRILEKTSAIGIMKSFGASNRRVRMIFLYISSFILIRGMVLGNIIGMGIALLQQQTGLITLDQETYYVSTVPVHFDLMYLAGINLMVFATGVVFMVLPSMIVSRIYPARTLRI
jgi:lipoprotein-releasing system permease protein